MAIGDSCMMQRSLTLTPSIFVNGQRYALMEDYRFPVHQYFAVGTMLYDPQLQPPQPIPLCTAPEERGVTVRKLLPNADYHAYLLDPVSGTLYSPPVTYTCLYVTNLPPHTTPEMLGRFFEAFDMVKEADVFPGQRTACNGRGWVVLQDASKLLLVPRVMEFVPNHLIYAELSDQLPVRRPPPTAPLPTVPQAESKSSVTGTGRAGHGHAPARHSAAPVVVVDPTVPPSAMSGQTPSVAVNTITVPPPRSSTNTVTTIIGDGTLHDRRVTGHGFSGSAIVGRTPAVATAPVPRSVSLQSSPPATVTATSLRCFVMYVTESDAAAAVHEGVFWPSPPLQSRLARIAEANESQARTATTSSASSGIVVHIFFMMRTREATVLFGVSRVLLDVNWPQEHGGGYQIEWLVHHLALRENALSCVVGASILFKLPDGAAVRSEIGEAITCAALRASPTRCAPSALPLSATSHSTLHHGGGNRTSLAASSLPPYPADYPSRGRGVLPKTPTVAPPPPPPASNGGVRAAPRSSGRGRGGSAASPLPPPPPILEASSPVNNRPPSISASGGGNHRGGGGPAIPKPASRQRKLSPTYPPNESATAPTGGARPSPSHVADDGIRDKGDSAAGLISKDLLVSAEGTSTQVTS